MKEYEFLVRKHIAVDVFVFANQMKFNALATKLHADCMMK